MENPTTVKMSFAVALQNVLQNLVCSNLPISISYEIISLLARRSEYVDTAAKYKTSTESVRAEDRVQKMPISRRRWAEEAGINPDFIAELYRAIVDHYVAQELDSWKNR